MRARGEASSSAGPAPAASSSARPGIFPGVRRAVVVAALREIAARLRLGGENPFRARAYEGGGGGLGGLSDRELAGHLERGTLTEVPGIGQALASVTEELARTGK